MSPKKIQQMIILNVSIAAVDIILFSNMFLGLSFFSGNALSISAAWTAALFSGIAFVYGNSLIMKKKETRMLLQSINSLNDCIPVFSEAIHNGDVFDKSQYNECYVDK